jgi:hypothetical protein
MHAESKRAKRENLATGLVRQTFVHAFFQRQFGDPFLHNGIQIAQHSFAMTCIFLCNSKNRQTLIFSKKLFFILYSLPGSKRPKSRSVFSNAADAFNDFSSGPANDTGSVTPGYTVRPFVIADDDDAVVVVVVVVVVLVVDDDEAPNVIVDIFVFVFVWVCGLDILNLYIFHTIIITSFESIQHIRHLW